LIDKRIQSPKAAARLVLVPNNRRLDGFLATALRGQPDGTVMVQPAVAVLSQWVASTLRQILWLKGLPSPRAVDPQHHLQSWQSAWPDSERNLSDTEKQLAARQAMAADRLIRQWGIDAQPIWLERSFYTARQAVERQRNAQGWCTAEEQLAQFCEWLESGSDLPLRLPTEIQLEGFQEWTQLESRLLEALRQRGVMVLDETRAAPHPELPPERQSAERGCLLQACATPEAELQAAAEWARAQLQTPGFDAASHSIAQSIAPSIAVVIHGLDQAPEAARRAFERELGGPGQHQSTAEPQFHLPYGAPLLAHACVQDLLMLLRLAQQGPRKRIAFPTLSRLLLSPHWGHVAGEQPARAQLEVKLRDRGGYYLSIASLFETIRQEQLEDVLEDSVATLRSALAVDWTDDDALELATRAWGWPGPHAAGHGLAALVAAVRKLLEHARNLDGLAVAQRLQALQQMCANERQQGVGGPLSPIQLLTPEDAVGRSFSAARVVGLNASNWPGQPLSNPFLPPEVMRQIPRASAAGELRWCEHITAGLKQLAPEVCFSWSQLSDDLPQQPSPLLAGLPQAPEPAEKVPVDGAWRSYADHPWLSEVPDGQGVALAEGEPIMGGASTLTAQAASPLKAYLKYRLHVQFDEMPEPFADALWRGSLLHRALQALYQPVLGKIGVPAASSIPGAVEAALQAMRAFNRLTPIQYRAEQLRLQRVLHDWLELERSRAEFRVIALEQKLETTLLGHPIQLRIDRADQLAGQVDARADARADADAGAGEPAQGSILVIDYKSGKTDLGPWSKDRLGEAQLPLYAISWQQAGSHPGEVTGMALAQVKYGETSVKGVVADAAHEFGSVRTFGTKGGAVHKRFSDWNEALQHWKSAIEALATEFIQGDARNIVYDPKNLREDELSPLLRLEEGAEWLRQRGIAVALLGDDDSDEAEDEE
jgi:ATP-dependent helicase/nuclease subunit B